MSGLTANTFKNMYNAINALIDFYKNISNDNVFKREVSCFATSEDGVISITSNNSSGAVEFDFFTIWEYFKKNRPKNICMIHSHPDEMDFMSSIDENMVHGWVLALGVEILFMITTNNGIVGYMCKKVNNKIEIYPIDNVTYSRELELLSSIVYGMSSSKELSKESIDNVTKNLVESGINPSWIIV